MLSELGGNLEETCLCDETQRASKPTPFDYFFKAHFVVDTGATSQRLSPINTAISSICTEKKRFCLRDGKSSHMQQDAWNYTCSDTGSLSLNPQRIHLWMDVAPWDHLLYFSKKRWCRLIAFFCVIYLWFASLRQTRGWFDFKRTSFEKNIQCKF